MKCWREFLEFFLWLWSALESDLWEFNGIDLKLLVINLITKWITKLICSSRFNYLKRLTTSRLWSILDSQPQKLSSFGQLPENNFLLQTISHSKLWCSSLNLAAATKFFFFSLLIASQTFLLLDCRCQRDDTSLWTMKNYENLADSKFIS